MAESSHGVKAMCRSHCSHLRSAARYDDREHPLHRGGRYAYSRSERQVRRVCGAGEVPLRKRDAQPRVQWTRPRTRVRVGASRRRGQGRPIRPRVYPQHRRRWQATRTSGSPPSSTRDDRALRGRPLRPRTRPRATRGCQAGACPLYSRPRRKVHGRVGPPPERRECPSLWSPPRVGALCGVVQVCT